MTNTTEKKVRLDKWLWASRFFKTRSRAAQAVNGGKVHLNGGRVKAARSVNVGDDLLITRGNVEFSIRVMALSLYRRPAVEAQLLYEESEESISAREEKRELRKLFNQSHSSPPKKPNKRDRRKIKEFVRKN